VDCGVTFPSPLAGGETLVCSYASLLPDAEDRLNTATVTTTNDSPIGGGTATADVVFSSSPTNKIDDCVDVSDSLQGSLGMVCVAASPKTFTYSRDIQQTNSCETSQVVNTATFTSTTSDATDSSTVIVYVDQEYCQNQGGGCTLTIGYWKTHSEFGPAPYDDTWAQLSSGASTPFFGSGKTWYQVFWTPPAGGNAYFILAHQYMGALLNQANSTNTSAVTNQLDFALAYFTAHAPGTAAPTGSLRNQVLQAAAVLAKFNEGVVGPGHCDE
jgi:hypothetical protein